MAEWIALIPLMTIAGSAVAYVVKLYFDATERRQKRFFELMALLDRRDLPIASKVAAIYELCQFPEHRGFIIRFCQTQRENISGDSTAASAMIAEFEATLKFFQKS